MLCCGRRFGKNVVGHDLAIKTALDGFPVAWVAPTFPELDEDFSELYGKLYSVISAKNESKHRLDLITGGFIKMWSLDGKQGMRGKHYKRVIINEAAKIASLETEWNEVIRATLADLRGDTFFLSTPKGLNYFYSLYQRAEDNTEWARWHYTTYDNPFIDPAEIEAMRREMPERVFRQEILAEFVEDGAYFQNVEACAVIEAPDLPAQHAGHSIVMGVDWAKSEDYTVLTVGCRPCARVVDWQRFNKIDYHFQRGMLIDLARKWNCRHILAESNSIGVPNIEELQRAGMPVIGFETTAISKPLLIEELALVLARGEIKVPKDYGDELRMYEVEIGTSGRPKFGAPQGAHDDRVISLALCLKAMAPGRQLVAFGGDD